MNGYPIASEEDKRSPSAMCKHYERLSAFLSKKSSLIQNASDDCLENTTKTSIEAPGEEMSCDSSKVSSENKDRLKLSKLDFKA